MGCTQLAKVKSGFLFQIANHDLRTDLSEKFGDSTADSGAGTGNNSDLIFQPKYFQ